MANILQQLEKVSFATLGHFLEEGFCDPSIKRLTGTGRAVGRARTTYLSEANAALVDEAMLKSNAGEVLVVGSHQGFVHACVGEVTGRYAKVLGLRGLVVGGPVTDIEALNAMEMPVWGTGLTNLTTKRRPLRHTRDHAAVVVGGVPVADGDIVLADENGVVVLTERQAMAVIRAAANSDKKEPELLATLTGEEKARSSLRERVSKEES